MITIRDSNNPLELCSIEISKTNGFPYPGLFEVVGESIKIWFLLNCITPNQLDELCAVLFNTQLHTLKITTNQRNLITCFQACTLSPIDNAIITHKDGSVTKKPYVMVPNGLILMQSQNWIEDILLDDLNEQTFHRAVFTFPFLPYWFRKTLNPNTSETIDVESEYSITFRLEEVNTINKYELLEKKAFISKVIIESRQTCSVLAYYKLHHCFLLLFRFCSGLNIPKAYVSFECGKVGDSTNPPHVFKFHYLYPLKGLTEEPNPNLNHKHNVPLKALIEKPSIISRWVSCVKKYEHAMDLLGEALYSSDVILSDRVLKLLQAFDRLNKGLVYSDQKKRPSFKNRLNETIKKYGLSFDTITDLGVDDICECLKNYRNSESHGDCRGIELSFEQMESIMHIILIKMIIDKVFYD